MKLSFCLSLALVVATLAPSAFSQGPASAPGPAPAIAASAPPVPAAPAQPPAECLALLDRLSQGIPRDETGPALRSKGLQIRSPIIVPGEVITEKNVTSGVRVRVLINAQGRVIPGSVTVQQSVGDPKLPLAMSEAVPATLSFDVSRAFSVPKEFAFSTVYVNCAQQ